MKKQLERLEVFRTFADNSVIYTDDKIKKELIQGYDNQIKLMEGKIATSKHLLDEYRFRNSCLKAVNQELTKKNRLLVLISLFLAIVNFITLLSIIIEFY